jgi:hypothetical protein
MIHDAIFLLVGAFIGWLTPEPQFAKNVVAKVKGWLVSKLPFTKKTNVESNEATGGTSGLYAK